MVHIELHPRRIAVILVAAAATLVGLYLATQYYRIRIAPAKVQAAMKLPDWPAETGPAMSKAEKILNPRRLVTFCDMDAEANLPSTWSVFQLFLAAGILGLIARQKKAISDHWWFLWTVLAIGFMVLALDEGGSLHGSLYLSATTEDVRKSRGVFYFSWIIPAMIIAVVIALAYLRFLLTLPARTRWLILLAGIWYVGSAVGGEMVQGWWQANSMGRFRFGWVAITIIEETGELLAIALFIHTLLCYMRDQKIAVALGVAEKRATQAPVPSAIEPPAPLLPPTAAGVNPRASG